MTLSSLALSCLFLTSVLMPGTPSHPVPQGPGDHRPPGVGPAPARAPGQPRRTTGRPERDPSDAQLLARASNELGLALFRQKALAEDGDLALSPASLHAALLLTWVGSRGESRAAFDRVLGLAPLGEADPARVDAAAAALLERLAVSGTGEAAEDHLRFANALFGQEGRSWVPETLEELARFHGAPLHLVDWRGDTEGARRTVNDWVLERTEQRIAELVPADAVSAETGLVLTSALHLASAWAHPFQERWTRPLDFHLTGGETVQVPYMVGRARHGYARVADVQVLDMALRLQGFRLTVLLPDDDAALERLLHGLDDAHLRALLEPLTYPEVKLELPRSRVESSFRLGDALKSMGLAAAFTRGADLSGFDGTRDLQVDEVLQKTFLELDEDGVEAAAATAVVMRVGAAAVDEARPLRVDRPHLLLLREASTGQVLMVARVSDPR